MYYVTGTHTELYSISFQRTLHLLDCDRVPRNKNLNNVDLKQNGDDTYYRKLLINIE